VKNDPHEEHNLIFDPKQQRRITEMRADLHQILESADANRVPFSNKRSMGSNLRLRSGSTPADFPPQLMRDKNAKE
jgi:N-acetylglucosamine-6-sulfatase